MREIAAHLNGMGCKVRLALPEGETGGDVADWIAADGADAALERIAELLELFQPPAEPGPEPAAEAEREGGELSEHAVALAFTALPRRDAPVRPRSGPLVRMGGRPLGARSETPGVRLRAPDRRGLGS